MATKIRNQKILLLLLLLVFISFFRNQSYVKAKIISESGSDSDDLESGSDDSEPDPGTEDPGSEDQGTPEDPGAPEDRGAPEDPAAPEDQGAPDDQGVPPMEDTCGHTQFYDLCISSLESDARSYDAEDVSTLLKISIDLARTNASNVLDYIQNWMSNNTSLTNMSMYMSSMQTCSDYYNSTITSLQYAMEDVDDEEYDGVNMYVDEAMTNTDFCNIEIVNNAAAATVAYDEDEGDGHGGVDGEGDGEGESEGGGGYEDEGEGDTYGDGDNDVDEDYQIPTLLPLLTNMNEMMYNLLQISMGMLCYLSPETLGCTH